MDVSNPKRILFLGTLEAGVLDVVKELAGSATSAAESDSIAGLTHEWNAQTAYYTAKIPIWIDDLSDLDAWKTEFCRPEAKEVVEAVGAWIYCFQKPRSEETAAQAIEALKTIRDVIEHHVGDAGDTVMLAVATTSRNTVQDRIRTAEEWEDDCLEHGFEYIDFAATGTNQFSEKVGFERMKEALEAHEWAGSDPGGDDLGLDDLGFDDEGDASGFDREEAEMTAELFSMKAAMHREEDDSNEDEFMTPSQQAADVDNVDRLMAKLLAVKENSADLSKEQRKRMAAQAVRDLMRDEKGG